MSNVLNFALPVGYRVTSTDDTSVECERACGWKMRLTTLSALPAHARDQLFRFHDAWHTNAR